MAGVKRLLLLCLLVMGLIVLALAVFFIWQALTLASPPNERTINFDPEPAGTTPTHTPPASVPGPPARVEAQDSPQPMAGESPTPPLRPGLAPRVGPGITPAMLQVAERYLNALNTGDAPTAMGLMTGYETAAARKRQAALAEGEFLSRQDLSAQQRLAILALRDRYTRSEIEALPSIQVMLTTPGDAPILPAPDTPIELGSLRLDALGWPSLRLIHGAQERTLRMAKDRNTWRIQADFLFDPARLTPRDAEILTQVGEKGGGNRAWLEIYAAMASTDVDASLLQPPS